MSPDNRPGEICAKTPIPPRPQLVVNRRQQHAKDRVRKFKRHRVKWTAARVESFWGPRYADMLEGGSARPYELGGQVVHDLRRVLSRNAVELLQHLLAMERGFGGNRGGARLPHATSARILRCCERTAGAAMRELAAHGLVEARWHFDPLSDDERAKLNPSPWVKLREKTPAYVTTSLARELCGRRERRISRSNQVGKKAHPGKTQSPLRGDVKGARGRGRPERSFVSDVLRARQVEKPAPRVATVIERRPDGRVLLGSPLTPGVGRLSEPRVAKVRVDDTSVEFFTTLCPGTWQAISDDESGNGGGGLP